MKRNILITMLIGSFGFATFNTSIPIGSPLPKPDTRLIDISGKEITLKSSMQEGGLLVMFSCNTCPVVRGYQERTRGICNYAISKRLGVVLLNSNESTRDEGDSFDDMKSYASNQQYKWIYAVDKNNEVADAFGAIRTPERVIPASQAVWPFCPMAKPSFQFTATILFISGRHHPGKS